MCFTTKKRLPKINEKKQQQQGDVNMTNKNILKGTLSIWSSTLPIQVGQLKLDNN